MWNVFITCDSSRTCFDRRRDHQQGKLQDCWDSKRLVKWSRYRHGVAQKVGRGIALLFHDRGTRRGWVVSSTPRPQVTPGKTRYPFYGRLGGSQGRSGRAENLVPTGIRSRTVQPVVSLLYRLSYLAHTGNLNKLLKFISEPLIATNPVSNLLRSHWMSAY